MSLIGSLKKHTPLLCYIVVPALIPLTENLVDWVNQDSVVFPGKMLF